MKKIAQSARQWDGPSQGSKYDKGDFFYPFRNVQNGSGARVMYCNSPGTNRPGREPNNSPVSSAEVMMLSTKVPLVLRFQLNEQQ